MNRKTKKVVDSKTIMTEMIMPNDTNPIHNLMGGNLMRWMDIAAGICAGKHCENYVVTVSVDYVSFQKPIPLGDVITIECSATRAFNTSVEIYVEVFSSDIRGGNSRRCNDAYFTFVAVEGDSKKPCKVPELLALTSEEIKRYEEALLRRQLRLLQSGRLKIEDAPEVKEWLIKK
jgi:acyl-CoA hydrolase